LIRTVSRRGYQFTGEIQSIAPAVPASARRSLTNLPAPVSALIGRDDAIREVCELVTTHRLITLVGAGGIGKTQLGLEVGRRLLPTFADGIRLAAAVPWTVAGALELTSPQGVPSPESVAAALANRHVLLLLDNCEHVIEAAARMAEAILRSNPRPCVLATSREPLRLPGEIVYSVPPLHVPVDDDLTEEELLQTGAVGLFIARARDAHSDFSATGYGKLLAVICRRLDGIPLAIELAAARSASLGVEALAARLDDRFRLLAGGHRTALPRHQTLQATLDWSFELLSETEQVALRRLSVFAGSFTLEAAAAVAADPTMPASDVVDGVASLVGKSLLTVAANGPLRQYRLHETTRAYAMQKLGQSNERDAVSHVHAEYLRDVFEAAAAECSTRPKAEWLAAYAHQLDNLHEALDWAFSPRGNAEIGVALTAAAVPLWFYLDQATQHDMRLHAALAGALLYIKKPDAEGDAAWSKTLDIAEHLPDTDYKLRALWGLFVYGLNNGDYPAALRLAKAFKSAATGRGDDADALLADRLIGISLHYLGEQSAAREHLERMVGLYPESAARSDLVRFHSDQRVLAQSALAHVLWLQGFPDQAMQAAKTGLERAQGLDNSLSISSALGHGGCPVALLNGDLETAERFVRLQQRYSGPMLGHLWGRCFEGALLLQRGEAKNAAQKLLAATQDMRARGLVGLPFNAFLGYLAQSFGGAGRPVEGLAVVGEALERTERNHEHWCTAELLRIKGELTLLIGAAEAAARAEECFVQALDWARRQGNMSWELRCATSLARVLQRQARYAAAEDLLAAVYARFTEGFGTADLTTARGLLESLGHPL
jgi:predicted ATPase